MSWNAPMNGYGCDYCSEPAIGGCYGFHACPDHMNLAARDGQSVPSRVAEERDPDFRIKQEQRRASALRDMRGPA